MNNYGIIIEARTGSKRLPKKILKKINGISILEYLINRVKKQKKIKKIIKEKITKKADLSIKKIAKKKKISFFQGSENDLIKRTIDAAKKNNIENIIQVTADNPFFDLNIFNQLLNKFKSKKYIFVSNSINGNFPIGADIRIFNINALKKTSKFVKKKARQHTCYYFLKNKDRIKSFTLKAKGIYRRPQYRLTIDYSLDFKFVKKIILNFKNEYCSLKEIINYLDKKKHLLKINDNLPTKLKIPNYN